MIETKIPYRVVQWATGTVGAVAMRGVIQHPQMELVGAYVYSVAKEGQDVGVLCGLPATGIKATRSVDAILDLKPDCLIYMPESTIMADVVRILESGINIVTTRPEFFNPEKMVPSERESIEAACRRGNSSIHATGSSPGFITEALPIVLTSLSRRLDFLSVDEFSLCLGGVVSEEMLTTFMGFGDSPEQFSQRKIGKRDEVFEHSLSLIAEAFGVPIEHFSVATSFALAKAPIPIGVRTIAPGEVAAQRVETTGYRAGVPFMRFCANWYISTDLDPGWELPSDSGWKIRVESDTPLEVQIGFPVTPRDREFAFRGLTAHRPVNVIPYICAAPAGIITTVKLPQVIARFG